MSKAILLSIKPKYVVDILNGKKTIEIRKTIPKCDLPIDVYIYCTKGKPGAILTDKGCVLANKLPVGGNSIYKSGYSLDGQVVAKFSLRKVDEHHVLPTENILPFNWNVEKKLSELCLTKEEVMAYGHGEDYQAFLWYIEDLVIFDIPAELSDFYLLKECKRCKTQCACFNKGIPCMETLTKAPQNFCYVESEE